jgi:hypothetical protein
VGTTGGANADLTDAVGWTPTPFMSVHPAFQVPALVASQAGPFNW